MNWGVVVLCVCLLICLIVSFVFGMMWVVILVNVVRVLMGRVCIDII